MKEDENQLQIRGRYVPNARDNFAAFFKDLVEKDNPDIFSPYEWDEIFNAQKWMKEDERQILQGQIISQSSFAQKLGDDFDKFTIKR